MLFIGYPPCSTCKKAMKYLDELGWTYEYRNIKTATPTVEELTVWIKQSGLPLKRWFNTSGDLYKTFGLKDKLATMSEKDAIILLSQYGMLIRRPIVVQASTVIVGYHPEQYDLLKHSS